MTADAGAFPDAVVRKERSDHPGIVIVVADGTVARLELFDRLEVFENGDAFFEFRNIHVQAPLGVNVVAPTRPAINSIVRCAARTAPSCHPGNWLRWAPVR